MYAFIRVPRCCAVVLMCACTKVAPCTPTLAVTPSQSKETLWDDASGATRPDQDTRESAASMVSALVVALPHSSSCSNSSGTAARQPALPDRGAATEVMVAVSMEIRSAGRQQADAATAVHVSMEVSRR